MTAARLVRCSLPPVAGGLASLLVGWLLDAIDLSMTWPAHGWLLVLGLGVHAGGWLLISIGLPRLPAAVTSVLLTIQPVASVLLGRLIFAETPSTLQLAGVGTCRHRAARNGS